MVRPARFVVDATGNNKQRGVVTEVYSNQGFSSSKIYWCLIVHVSLRSDSGAFGMRRPKLLSGSLVILVYRKIRLSVVVRGHPGYIPSFPKERVVIHRRPCHVISYVAPTRGRRLVLKGVILGMVTNICLAA